MALVIFVDKFREPTSIPSPMSMGAALRALELDRGNLVAEATSDGALWAFEEEAIGLSENDRATSWLNDRGFPGCVRGPVLYLSASEAKTVPWLEIRSSGVVDATGTQVMGGTQIVSKPTVPKTTPKRGTSGAPVPAMVAVTGKTFDVKEELKKLGGRWDPDAKAWMIPVAKAAEARAIVGRGAVKTNP